MAGDLPSRIRSVFLYAVHSEFPAVPHIGRGSLSFLRLTAGLPRLQALEHRALVVG